MQKSDFTLNLFHIRDLLDPDEIRIWFEMNRLKLSLHISRVVLE